MVRKKSDSLFKKNLHLNNMIIITDENENKTKYISQGEKAKLQLALLISKLDHIINKIEIIKI